MRSVDIVVIGSSAAGLVAATTAKRVYKDRSVLVVTTQETTMIPCGIPYIFGSVGSSEKNILPAPMALKKSGVDFVVDCVNKIDKENQILSLADGEDISYERLLICTGSTPHIPEWLNGHDLENVFTVPKNKSYLDDMQKRVGDCNKIVVVGAGFIGVELSDELNKLGKSITLVERLPHILGLAFDEDISSRVEEIVKDRGVTIKTGSGVKEICGDGKVEYLLLESGEKIEADCVILSMGYKPNTQLAKDCGISISEKGFIKVDEYLRTDSKNIFAVGDCAEKHDFITRRPSQIMLASTATAEARTAGMNLYSISTLKTFSGTISIFATAIGDQGFGVAGITEDIAKSEGFKYVVGEFEGIDRHPGTLSDCSKQYVKLIVAKDSGVILGGEVHTGLSAGELTNIIGIMIQNRMTIHTILTSQIGSHPLLTASPAAYPLIKAVENVSVKL